MTTAGRTVLFSLAHRRGGARVAARVPAALPLLDGRRRADRARSWPRSWRTTLLPAILALLGPRVNALSPQRWQAALAPRRLGERGGFWYRLSHAIMRRPVPVAAGARALLIVLGIPFWGIKFTGVDASVLPRDHSRARGRRRARDASSRPTARRRSSSPRAAAARSRRRRALRAAARRRCRGVVGAPRVQPARGLYRIDLVARGRAARRAGQASSCATSARSTPPVPVRVGGVTAAFLDQQKALERLAAARARRSSR